MVIVAAAQQPADPVELVVFAAAVPAQFLLDAPAGVVDGGEPEA